MRISKTRETEFKKAGEKLYLREYRINRYKEDHDLADPPLFTETLAEQAKEGSFFVMDLLGGLAMDLTRQLKLIVIPIVAITLFMSFGTVLFAAIAGAGYDTEAFMDYGMYGLGSDLLSKVEELGRIVVSDGNWIYSQRGTQKSLAAARNSGHPKTNCTVAVSIALQEAGILEKNQFFYPSKDGRVCGNRKVIRRIHQYFDVIKTGGKKNAMGVKLKPGDVCVWSNHVNVYAGRTQGEKVWYDFGRKSVSDKKANSGHFVTYIHKGAPGNTLYRILRLKNREAAIHGKAIRIPDGLGGNYTYMGWSLIHNWPTRQYYLRETSGEHYDKNGFAVVNGRYVIACTTTFGKVGDYIDFVLDNGRVIHTIMGDEKSQRDRGCNRWGHDKGRSVVEFVVNKQKWYHQLGNNDIVRFHPEWRSRVKMGVNLGKNYFNNDNRKDMEYEKELSREDED